MQSIKQWHTPPDRAHNQHSMSIYWSIDSPIPTLLQFTRLYIKLAHKKVSGRCTGTNTHKLFTSLTHTRNRAHRRDWLAYFTRRGEKCSITEMSRCFKGEICFGTQQQLMKCDLEFFFFHFCCIRIMNGAGSGEKEERGKKQIEEPWGTIFMVITISCQQRRIKNEF